MKEQIVIHEKDNVAARQTPAGNASHPRRNPVPDSPLCRAV
ncbi:MAG: hypothetical protein ACI4XW_13350 [Candidatus Spyradocola sp.]